jgi:hypothetical protein
MARSPPAGRGTRGFDNEANELRILHTHSRLPDLAPDLAEAGLGSPTSDVYGRQSARRVLGVFPLPVHHRDEGVFEIAVLLGWSQRLTGSCSPVGSGGTAQISFSGYSAT